MNVNKAEWVRKRPKLHVDCKENTLEMDLHVKVTGAEGHAELFRNLNLDVEGNLQMKSS